MTNQYLSGVVVLASRPQSGERVIGVAGKTDSKKGFGFLLGTVGVIAVVGLLATMSGRK